MLTGLVIVMIWLARLGLRSSTDDPIKREFEAEIPTGVPTRAAIIWFIIGLVAL
jgi:hypothetical protein